MYVYVFPSSSLDVFIFDPHQMGAYSWSEIYSIINMQKVKSVGLLALIAGFRKSEHG